MPRKDRVPGTWQVGFRVPGSTTHIPTSFPKKTYGEVRERALMDAESLGQDTVGIIWPNGVFRTLKEIEDEL